jgi:hypothetical protein
MSRFDEDPADDRAELDLCIEEIKNLRNQLAAKDAEIERLKKTQDTCICMDCGKVIKICEQSKHSLSCPKTATPSFMYKD